MLNEKLNEKFYKKMDLNIMYFGSGTLSGTSTSSGGECRMLWSSSVISGTNKSNVTTTFQARRKSSGETYCTLSGTLKIDGTAKSVSKYRPSSDPWNNTWKEVGSQTKEVTHSADGSKTITVSGDINGDAASMQGNFKVSANITLDKINRASVLGNIANFGINDTITIPITKYVPTFTDKLEIKIGTTLIRTVNPITNGYSLTFTSGEKNAILALMTSPKVTMTFILTTLDGVTVQGTSTKTAQMSSLDMPVLINYVKKPNGKYQMAVNGTVDPTKGSFQAYDDDGKEYFNEVVLYNNESGSNGTIALSETAENFKYIEIIFRDNDQTYSSVMVYKPNGKFVDLTTLARWSSTFYIKQKRVAISGTSITSENATEVQLTTAPKITINTSANNIYITRVVGYR